MWTKAASKRRFWRTSSRPAAWRAASIVASASAVEVANGFSAMTCLPACSPAMLTAAWVSERVAVTTRSTSRSCTSSR